MLLSARELMPIVCSALQRGQRVRLTATGGSMRPFIHNGDVVELEPLNSQPAIGDVVLVRCGSEQDRYVLHRVVRVKRGKIFIRGDAQDHREGPFTQEDVFGRVTRSYSKGRIHRFDSGPYRLAGLAWLRCCPLSVWLLRVAVQLSEGRRERI